MTLLQERPKFASVMGEEAASSSGDGGGAGGAKAAEAGGGGAGLAAAENAGELPAHSLLYGVKLRIFLDNTMDSMHYTGRQLKMILEIMHLRM